MRHCWTIAIGFTAVLFLSACLGPDGIGAGRVWEDVNRNGVFDPDEPVVPGATVRILRSDNPEWVLFETQTDEKGEYYVEFASEGSEQVIVEFDYQDRAFTLQNQGGNDDLDSDVDASGRSGPQAKLLRVDAGLMPLE